MSHNLPMIHPLALVMNNITPPLPNTTNTSVYFKYMIGDVFFDEGSGDIIEITGYNYLLTSYKGNMTMKISGIKATIQSNIIYEERLNRMKRYSSLAEFMNSSAKDTAIKYRVHYFDPDVQGQRANYQDVTLSNVRALARLLNAMVRINPKRRIVMVSVIDDNGKFLTHVRLLDKEIKEQKFLTGFKERLLAHAKYKCGYEVVTGF